MAPDARAPSVTEAAEEPPTVYVMGADLALSITTPFSVTRVAISSVCWPAVSAGSGDEH